MAYVKIKRIYEAPAPEDGFRILVDRLWPRGVSKENAHVDLWLKEIAPSDDLRKWFGHDPAKWEEFREKYNEELDANESAVTQVCFRVASSEVTLLYAAKDEEHNNAVVLQDYFEQAC